jgi:class 3 adenylate cyclase
MDITRDLVQAGRDAIGRHDWEAARDLLTRADAEEPLAAPDLERLAEAAWWTARLEECISARERAYRGRVAAGEPREAAIVALALAKDYYAKGAGSIGSAWLSRAERLLEEEPDCAEHGWLERLRGVIALEGSGDFDAALDHARRAHELAQAFGESDLLAVSLHDQGRALVMRGDVDEGLALIDEATVPALAGELSAYNTGVVYCNTITACKELADFRRAGDWTEAAKRWCERHAVAGFPGMCRVYRASIMLVRGAWQEAEEEARKACGELPTFNVAYAAEAFYELGEIRFQAGDLDGAEDAFRQAHELGRDPQPGLALLRLAQGKSDGAEIGIARALETDTPDLHRARLLPARIQVALARGETEAARLAVDELGSISDRYGSEALRAAARAARAELALALGDAREAVANARDAGHLWRSVDAPYEVARARVTLGKAYAALGADDDAALELQAAANAFARLGAARDLRDAREALGRFGGSPGGNGRTARTFMFTDIVRSTDLVEAIGDGAWLDLVRWHDRMLRSLFEAHGGEEVDHAGDGFFVAFADASAAIACAVEIQRRLAQHRRDHGFAPQVRVGLHATEAEADGANYKGRGVHEAARISAVAQGGEIVASRATVAGARSIAVSEVGEVKLKGIERPVELVALDWQ